MLMVWYENLTEKGSEWKRHVIYGPFDQAFDAVAGDLDRDGDFDVVATAWGDQGQIVWFENPGRADRAWVHHPLKQDWKGAIQPIIVDLDGDERLDIVATAEQRSLECRWWRNLGVPDQK